jgi:hypothetical protein
MSTYLGYQWQDEVSILASRLTLLFGKEIKLSFLSDTRVKAKGEYDKEPEEYTVQGFCLSSGSSHSDKRDQIREMLKDLKCIHLNERYNYEIAFTVCAYPSVMQAWYDMMHEGTVCTQLINRVGGCDALTRMYTEGKDNELDILKEEISNSLTKYTVSK